jgi:DNA transformation protein
MTKDYLNYILDVLSICGKITARAMFGGYGIYKNGIIFAIIVDNELYFKVDKSNINLYQNFNSEAFTFKSKGKIRSMSYWKIPEEIIEDEKLLMELVELSYLISSTNRGAPNF